MRDFPLDWGLGPSRGGRPFSTVPINGDLVKALRGRTKQKTFAHLLGISEDTLQKAEHGYASEETLDLIFKYTLRKRSLSAILTPATLKLKIPEFLKPD
jgi:DNA-binding XRE family transcriptional regulator